MPKLLAGALFLLALFLNRGYSQSISINNTGTPPNSSSMLDVQSSSKGILLPRINLTSTSDATTIPSAATSLLVYNTNASITGGSGVGFYYWSGTQWMKLITTAWNLNGNAGTDTSTNFFGTTDNMPIRLKINNIPAGLIGLSNTFIGQNAGYRNSGTNNVGLGYEALYTNTGEYNVAIGVQPLRNNTNGSDNNVIGNYAMHNNTSGTSNNAVGVSALEFNISGAYNDAFGTSALRTNVSGIFNTGLGEFADVASENLTNATAIGAESFVGCSHCMVLGSINGVGAGYHDVNVGIGTSTPISALHVKGAINVFNGGVSAHTGNFYNGTSNINGIEIFSDPAGDAFTSIQRGTGGYCLHLSKPAGGGNSLEGFFFNGTQVGQITTNGTTTTYSTTSDIRLKENIISSRYGLNTIMKLDVIDYDFKTDTNKELQTGFSAQDLYKIFPQAVQVGGADPKTNPWTVDYSKLTPLLVKAVQDQQVIIDKEENEIREMREEIAEIKKLIKH
jgi:hypothetical protein